MKRPFQIKVCGITSPNDALMACELGVDAIGFNFYSLSPRFVNSNLAGEIALIIDGFNQSSLQRVKKVGVFVNLRLEQILANVLAFSLDGIQFHGDENFSVVPEIRESLNDHFPDCLLIRAIRTKSVDDKLVHDLDETAGLQAEIDIWTQAGIDAILLDAGSPSQFGGTGQVLDWDSVANLRCEVPLILAGGLSPENVNRAIVSAKAQSIDVASGVESEPGIKDREKIRGFVAAARAAWG